MFDSAHELPWQVIDPLTILDGVEIGPEMRQTVHSWFRVRETIGRATRSRVIACSLFCKPVDYRPQLPPPSPTPAAVGRDSCNHADIHHRDGKRSWWSAYAAPLLRNLDRIPVTHPGCDVHIYLAGDLEWMAPDLARPQVVVHLMEHSSIAAAPGTLWRYLAHDLPGIVEIANCDAEDDWGRVSFARRIWEWRETPLALFRHVNPQEWDPVIADLFTYRPICACHLRYRPQRDFNMRAAVEAFAAAITHRRVTDRCRHPERGEVRMFGHTWPSYGTDQTFLQHIVYPFFLERGVYTNYNVSMSSVIFPLDVRLAAQAHPAAVVTQGA